MTIEDWIIYAWLFLGGMSVGMNLVVRWNRRVVKRGGHCACACDKGCC